MDDQIELFRVRLRFLDLVKSFFLGQPDAEKISRWRGTFSAMARERISPAFDQAVRELLEVLNTRAENTSNLSDLQEEYYALFMDPFEGSPVNMTVSHYLDGRNFGQSLVEIRGLLHEAGIAKDEAVKEPEDSLVVLLDAYVALVEEEQRGDKSEISGRLQVRLLEEFLLPFLEKFNLALEKNERANFFRVCGRFLRQYFELEKGLMVGGKK
ncbi:TorD/DmsD family molecular chaperone [Desulfomarina sp.]